MKTLLISFIIIILSVSALAEDPSWSSWLKTFNDDGAQISELNNLIQIEHNGEKLNLYKEMPSASNKKDPGSGENLKYTADTVFLVSDADWQTVLMGLPLTIWNPNDEDTKWCNLVYSGEDDFDYTEKCAYPYLIYHIEDVETSSKHIYDIDSIKRFIEQYQPKRIVHLGTIPDGLTHFLPYEDIVQLDLLSANILSYWDTPDFISFDKIDAVYVDDDYSLSILAAQYAAYKNAPLIIRGSALDTPRAYKKTNLICIGETSPSDVECDLRLNEDELKKELVELTGSDKALLINPNDIIPEFCEEIDFSTNNLQLIHKLYCKDSLAAAYLATAKEELIVELDLQPSYGINQFQDVGPKFPEHLATVGNTLFAMEQSGKIVTYKIQADGTIGEELTLKDGNEWTSIFDRIGNIYAIRGFGDSLFVLTNSYEGDGLMMYEFKVSIDIIRPVNKWELNIKNEESAGINFIFDVSTSSKGLIFFLNYNLQIQDVSELMVGLAKPESNALENLDTIEIEKINALVSDKTDLYVVDSTISPKINKFTLDLNSGKLSLVGPLEIDGDINFLDYETVRDIELDGDHFFILPGASIEKLKINREGGQSLSLEKIFAGRTAIAKFRDKYDTSGYFIRPVDIELAGGNIYVADIQLPQLPILSQSSSEHPNWHPAGDLITNPNDLLFQMSRGVSDAFDYGLSNSESSLAIPKYITILASPKAIQFSQLHHTEFYYTTGNIDKFWSIDFLAAELISLNRLTNKPVTHEERKKFVGPHMRPYGRIFGVSVSDTATYVARSVFIDRIENMQIQAPMLTILIGPDMAEQTLNEIAGIIATKEVGKGYYSYCYMDDELKNQNDNPLKCDNDLPNDYGYENTNILMVSVHGFVEGWRDFSTYSSDILDYNLLPMVVLASSCSNLDYYSWYQEKYFPPIGIAFMRSGAMGYLGLVTPGADKTQGNSLYGSLIYLLKEKIPWGLTITPQLGGLNNDIDDYWKNNRDKYEPLFTIVGDPTFKSKFFGRAIEYSPETEFECGCKYNGYGTEEYEIEGRVYCGLDKESRSRLEDEIYVSLEDLELRTIMYSPCLNYLDFKGFHIGNINVVKSLKEGLNIKYMDLRDTQISPADCRELKLDMLKTTIMCDPLFSDS